MGNLTLGILNSFVKSRKGKFSSFSKLGYGPAASLHSSSCLVSNDNYNPVFEIVSNLDDALNMFHKMIETRPLPSPVNLTKLLDLVTNKNNFSWSILLFKKMCANDVPFDNHTASIVIKCYCRLYNTEEGFTVLGSCFKQGIAPDVSTYNTILDGFILEDKTHEAETLFRKLIKNKLCEPNIVTYNTMIKGLCKIGKNYTAIALLGLMDGRGCTPNIVSYNTIIHSLCNDLMRDDAFKLFNKMSSYKRFPTPNVDTYNSMIYVILIVNDWDDVISMLQQMKRAKICPNSKTFNILVDALCKQGKVIDAQASCDIMFKSGNYPPDAMTYNSLVTGYCLQDEISNAWKVFYDMYHRRVKPHADSYNRILDWYSYHICLREVCDMLSVKNPFQRNSVTDYISKQSIVLFNGLTKQATCTPLDEMISQVKTLYEREYVRTLQDYIDRYKVEDALDLFHFLDGNELNSNINVYNILIDGVSKCGRLDIARRLFDDLSVKGLQHDVKTYTKMIRGFCAQGLLKDAKQLFLKMEKNDCRPNNFIINDLIQGYIDNKPFNDVAAFSWELERRGYKKTDSASFFFDERTKIRPKDKKRF